MQTEGGLHGPGLRVSRVLFPVRSLGDGARVGLWLQGCSLGCRGCVTPHLWSTEGGAFVCAAALARELVQRFPTLDGVTISGGEPFEQPEGIEVFGLTLRTLGVEDIGVYTGFSLRELDSFWPGRPWTAWVRWLIDGRYEASRQGEDGWRGSVNQRMYRVRAGQVHEDAQGFTPGPWSVALGGDGILLAGIPRRGDMAALREVLAAARARGRFT